MFKKDSLLNGIIIGVLVTVAGYFILHFLNVWISDYFFNKGPLFRESSIRVFAIFLNVFPFRYFMLKTDKEYTGRGILMVTFIVGLTYFFYYLQ
ncbi:MAG: hypothetical protein M3Q95_02165 [Bacteroidota bacterium]|nr:hypothetical protein [Bacteroidota bacterium]